MSMNLYFDTIVDGRSVCEDFPFQTPTNLSYRVMNLETKEEQINEIKSFIRINYEWDELFINEVIFRIEDMLENPETTIGIV